MVFITVLYCLIYHICAKLYDMSKYVLDCMIHQNVLNCFMSKYFYCLVFMLLIISLFNLEWFSTSLFSLLFMKYAPSILYIHISRTWVLYFLLSMLLHHTGLWRIHNIQQLSPSTAVSVSYFCQMINYNVSWEVYERGCSGTLKSNSKNSA